MPSNKLLVERQYGRAKFRLMSGDLLQTSSQVIVNPANAFLAPGGGVCGAIYKSAGAKPFQECAELLNHLEISQLDVGQCVLTTQKHLPNPHVQAILHVVGPTGDHPDRKEMLKKAYENALKMASAKIDQNNYYAAESVKGLTVHSIAFPSISTGIFHYPVKEAAEIAVKTIERFLRDNEADSTLDSVEMVILERDQELAKAFGSTLAFIT